jgi:hypothetical protein
LFCALCVEFPCVTDAVPQVPHAQFSGTISETPNGTQSTPPQCGVMIATYVPMAPGVNDNDGASTPVLFWWNPLGPATYQSKLAEQFDGHEYDAVIDTSPVCEMLLTVPLFCALCVEFPCVTDAVPQVPHAQFWTTSNCRMYGEQHLVPHLGVITTA